MKTTVLLLACMVVLGMTLARAESNSEVLQKLLTMERQAMDGWMKGDPDPALAVVDPDITFVHDVVGKRLQGLQAMKELYAQYRGMPLFDRYEILNPTCQAAADMAVLSYQLVQHNGDVTRYWNGTLVYRKRAEGWRVIHTHWSAAKEPQKQQ